MNNERQTECTLSDEELLQKVDEWNDKLCKTGAKAWTLSIPVNFNRDPDMLISELCKRFKQAINFGGNIHQETGKDWREMSNDEIECMVDEWHEADTRLSVYEYIGMTREEYYKWIKGEI